MSHVEAGAREAHVEQVVNGFALKGDARAVYDSYAEAERSAMKLIEQNEPRYRHLLVQLKTGSLERFRELKGSLALGNDGLAGALCERVAEAVSYEAAECAFEEVLAAVGELSVSDDADLANALLCRAAEAFWHWKQG